MAQTKVQRVDQVREQGAGAVPEGQRSRDGLIGRVLHDENGDLRAAVVEARNRNRRLGRPDPVDVVRAAGLGALGAPHDDVSAVRDQVLRAAVAFQEGQPPDDDITLVVGRVA